MDSKFTGNFHFLILTCVFSVLENVTENMLLYFWQKNNEFFSENCSHLVCHKVGIENFHCLISFIFSSV